MHIMPSNSNRSAKRNIFDFQKPHLDWFEGAQTGSWLKLYTIHRSSKVQNITLLIKTTMYSKVSIMRPSHSRLLEFKKEIVLVVY